MYSAQSGLCALSCQLRAPTRRLVRSVLCLPGLWLCIAI
jgi:hypothetical protein